MHIKENVPLSGFGTYRIGGPADYFLEAKTRDELLEGLAFAEEKGLPVFVFGGASNLLFDDAGFRGLVIQIKMKEIEVLEAHDFKGMEGKTLVKAESGLKISRMLAFLLKEELTGLEAWAGLPGTVGGAIFGNAGCFGVETKDILVEAEIYDGQMKTLGLDELDYDYRSSGLKKRRFSGENLVILSGIFAFESGSKETIEAEMKRIQELRRGKQPPGLTTGSFFKNPTGDQAAGLLIDQAGLKGFTIGGMKVSEDHANFFMNVGGATAKDVLALQEKVSSVVLEKHGIHLEREIVYVPSTGLA